MEPHACLERNATWSAQTLQEAGDWTCQPDPDQARDLRNAATPSDTAGGPDRRAELPDSCSELWSRALECLRVRYGVCLLRGLPVPDAVEDARRLCLLVGHALGTPVFQDASGGRVADVRGNENLTMSRHDPERDGTHLGSGDGEGTPFQLHSDPCDVAGLYCVRPAAEGGTSTIVSALAVHDRMRATDPDLLQALYEPLPYARPASPEQPAGWVGCPAFSWHDGYFKSHVVPDLLRAGQRVDGVPRLTDRQQAALERLYEYAYLPEFAVRVQLLPGDMILVNNHLVWHGRDAYVDRGEQVRHMMRLWLSIAGSRPLDPVHGVWIGDTSAGALRGGIHPERLAALARS